MVARSRDRIGPEGMKGLQAVGCLIKRLDGANHREAAMRVADAADGFRFHRIAAVASSLPR